MGEGQEVLLKHQLGDVYSYMQELQKVSKLQGIQAVLPYEININKAEEISNSFLTHSLCVCEYSTLFRH